MTTRVAKQKRPAANGAPGKSHQPRYPLPDSRLAQLENEFTGRLMPRQLRERVERLCARYNMDPAAFVSDAVLASVSSCEKDECFLLSTIEACNRNGQRKGAL